MIKYSLYEKVGGTDIGINGDGGVKSKGTRLQLIQLCNNAIVPVKVEFLYCTPGQIYSVNLVGC